jgi:hypothetical protein
MNSIRKKHTVSNQAQVTYGGCFLVQNESQEDEMLKADLFRPRVRKAKFRRLIRRFSLDFIATKTTKLIGIFA